MARGQKKRRYKVPKSPGMVGLTVLTGYFYCCLHFQEFSDQ